MSIAMYAITFFSCTRYAFREFDIGSVFAYIGCIYIAKHMGTAKSEKFDGIEIGNVTAMQ